MTMTLNDNYVVDINILLRGIISTPFEISQVITDIALDSRKVVPGTLFLAIKGHASDGRDYIDEAIRRGAVLVLYEEAGAKIPSQGSVLMIAVENLAEKIGRIAARFYGYPSRQMQMVGITGTNGKSSTALLIAHALNELSVNSGVIGTLGMGLYGALQPNPLTTPDAISVQQQLAKLVQQQAQVTAMEASSHGLDQGRLSEVEFDIAVFTNLTRDHLDYHGSLEAYGQAKALLFKMPSLRYAVINYDDEFGHKLLASLPSHINEVLYSLQPQKLQHPTVFADDIQCHSDGISARIRSPWGSGVYQGKLLGRFNLSNVLASLATLCIIGHPFKAALKALQTCPPITGRMQAFTKESLPTVVVDYAHTPDALQQALQALREHCRGRLICVFGCGGDRDKGKRPLMGQVAEQFADSVILTNDNPRTEIPEQIVKDILVGFKHSPDHIELDREQAIHDAMKQGRVGDVILIAGKGHEDYQQIGHEKFPFSDIEIVERWLQADGNI